MDELELRRRCYAQPTDPDPEFRRLLKEQPAAQRVASAVARFDQRLRFAMNQTPVPDGLAGRILLQVGMERRKRRQRRYALFAVAASLVVALGLNLWQPRPASPGSFGELALNHVYNEIQHLHDAGAVPQATVARLLDRMGGVIDSELGTVRFASLCPTPKGRGLHLVLDGEMGPVTVLYVPGASDGERLQRFADRRFAGVTRVADHGGSLAVIGERGENVEALAERISQQIQWTAALAPGLYRG